MTDIHAHVLPLVDDGSRSFEVSIQMLKNAETQGVTDMVLTPHYSVGEYETPAHTLKINFNDFSNRVKDLGININLYLGQEVFIRKGYKKLFESGSVLTMNGTKFVLIEFDTRVDFDVAETVYDLKLMGLEPIVAHFERYSYADVSVAEEIKSLGGFIQVNSESFVGKTKRLYYKKVKQLIKENLVDFVASDVHDFRENLFKKSFEFVCKKFGENAAEKLFKENAKKIILG